MACGCCDMIAITVYISVSKRKPNAMQWNVLCSSLSWPVQAVCVFQDCNQLMLSISTRSLISHLL